MAQRFVERNQPQVGGRGESEQIGIGPILWGRKGRPRQRPKLGFEFARLVQELDPLILEPAVIGLPGFLLASCLVGTHDNRCAQEAQKSELSEATEKETRDAREVLEPRDGNRVVDMAIVSERHPNVDVREKK